MHGSLIESMQTISQRNLLFFERCSRHWRISLRMRTAASQRLLKGFRLIKAKPGLSDQPRLTFYLQFSCLFPTHLPSQLCCTTFTSATVPRLNMR